MAEALLLFSTAINNWKNRARESRYAKQMSRKLKNFRCPMLSGQKKITEGLLHHMGIKLRQLSSFFDKNTKGRCDNTNSWPCPFPIPLGWGGTIITDAQLNHMGKSWDHYLLSMICTLGGDAITIFHDHAHFPPPGVGIQPKSEVHNLTILGTS